MKLKVPDSKRLKSVEELCLLKEPYLSFSKTDDLFHSAMIAHNENNSILFDNHMNKATSLAEENGFTALLSEWTEILVSESIEFERISS